MHLEWDKLKTPGYLEIGLAVILIITMAGIGRKNKNQKRKNQKKKTKMILFRKLPQMDNIQSWEKVRSQSNNLFLILNRPV
ncbi:Uncharacterised protein [Dorea longicatena]|nr:Uncharacterised protein [Dorea longicatena]